MCDTLEAEIKAANGDVNKLKKAFENFGNSIKSSLNPVVFDLMDKETWLTPKDAVDQGFADEILSVNNKAPQMVDSIGSIPLKNKVDQFMKFVVDQTNKNEEKSTINNSHDNQNHESYFDSALFKSKLKAIKGEKDGKTFGG